MKRFLIACLTVIAGLSVQAQEDNNLFNHLSVGVNAGVLGGFGVDVGVPVGNYIQLRAGYSFLPTLSVNQTLDISGYVPNEVVAYNGQSFNVPSEVDIEGNLGYGNAKFMVDLFPFRKASFHITAGAYIGSTDLVSVVGSGLMEVYKANQAIEKYNREAVGTLPGATEQDLIGVELGDYLLTADKNGEVHGNIEVAKVKPYVGIGFGRAVPKKRVGFMFELGAMFWGSPKVMCNGNQLTAESVGGEGGDILQTVSKVTVCPMLNFRLCGRLF